VRQERDGPAQNPDHQRERREPRQKESAERFGPFELDVVTDFHPAS
jgi:hypothetical protein